MHKLEFTDMLELRPESWLLDEEADESQWLPSLINLKAKRRLLLEIVQMQKWPQPDPVESGQVVQDN